MNVANSRRWSEAFPALNHSTEESSQRPQIRPIVSGKVTVINRSRGAHSIYGLYIIFKRATKREERQGAPLFLMLARSLGATHPMSKGWPCQMLQRQKSLAGLNGAQFNIGTLSWYTFLLGRSS